MAADGGSELDVEHIMNEWRKAWGEPKTSSAIEDGDNCDAVST